MVNLKWLLCSLRKQLVSTEHSARCVRWCPHAISEVSTRMSANHPCTLPTSASFAEAPSVASEA
eukprot:9678635-Prorocentrum_lima.AAC.1